MKKILFVVPYPVGVAGSQRFRFEQYFKTLEESGYKYEVSSFLDSKAWGILYKKGYFFQKLVAIIKGYLRRIGDLFRMNKFDIIFVHREVCPFGLPFFEWMLMKVSGKYSVFDFDDAIWIPNASESNWMSKYLKRYKNAANCCKWASVVSAGNKFLADYASLFNSNVIINPTTIDTNEHHNLIARHNNSVFTIGWTGSHSTVQYLDDLFPILQELEKEFSFEFHLISDIPAKVQLKSMKFIRWRKETEIDDLLKFDVGIMPLPDNVWTRGKCGFKALQYMALGIPAVVSDVGLNAEIVNHEVNGCVCKTADDWHYYLSKLMTDREYLLQLSNHTREKTISRYSLRSNKENFLGLFKRNDQIDS